MTDDVFDVEDPECTTTECDRDADVLLYLGLNEATLNPLENEYQWRCIPCKHAMAEGNELPTGAIEVTMGVDDD